VALLWRILQVPVRYERPAPINGCQTTAIKKAVASRTEHLRLDLPAAAILAAHTT
jgi:hypothetical protein